MFDQAEILEWLVYVWTYLQFYSHQKKDICQNRTQDLTLVGLNVKNIEPRDMQDHGTLVNIQAPTELNLGKFLFLKDVNIWLSIDENW